jgi:DNA polymerase-1
VIHSRDELFGKGKKLIGYGEIGLCELAKYATSYSRSIYCLEPIMKEKIELMEQKRLFYDIESPLIEVLADMEYNGINVDLTESDILRNELVKNLEILEKNIYLIAGEEFNINSPKQLAAILFEKLMLPAEKKTKTGYSTDAEVLEKMADKHEIVARILEYRQYMKLKSTYIDGLNNMINNKSKKIHSSFNQTITATGRISSTEPNLQNIPIKLELGRRIRKIFVPEEGCILIAADYSQIELRILAH